MQMADGSLIGRERGTPQGGVISPLLANLFLHYAFDLWMRRNFPDILFERYADDAICHCRDEDQATALRTALATRFAECGLTLHPEKTKIVYCKDQSRRENHPTFKFDFLGYTFRPRMVSKRVGGMGVSFSPAASTKALTAIRRTIRSWSMHRRSDKGLDDLARMFNSHSWLDQLLWAVLSFGPLPNLAAHRPDLGAVGERKVQVLARAQAAIPTLASAHRTPSASAVCSLGSALWTRPNNGSRMIREYHVRF